MGLVNFFFFNWILLHKYLLLEMVVKEKKGKRYFKIVHQHKELFHTWTYHSHQIGPYANSIWFPAFWAFAKFTNPQVV